MGVPMITMFVVLVFVAIAFAIGFVVGRTTAAGITVRDATRDPPPAAVALDDDAFAAQLLVHLAAGHKIEAIKLYRERTGLGLKEAKDAVEALERGDA
jgi:large subunit ribosomal protein L7/L12